MIREDHLPVWAIVPEVNRLLATESALVVTAPPGAGKSTVLPLTMLEAFPEGKILMLEPRRIAARQIAGRMAALLGEEVGETVGYRIRFEKRVSRRTRIEVLTEGVLTRILIDDPSLEGVSAVLFDEFHERSLQTDLALALCRESQAVLRPDLKLVLLSATIDADGLCRTLGAKHIDCPGKMFPVKTIHTGDVPPAQIEDAVVQTIRMAHRTEEGDILAGRSRRREAARARPMRPRLRACVRFTGCCRWRNSGGRLRRADRGSGSLCWRRRWPKRR